ncbi:hypothetical protein BGZ70_009697 [Mortierella alpina]|uniref:Small ribosomal subunit protein uS7 domain-containing protein n=1 Tax=Mortierella alpina TaxID=64518 RepID=A0A9P6LZH0_MORAP|nr:hypothetical protein BGZ70_009697 [Mortierella alpina]
MLRSLARLGGSSTAGLWRQHTHQTQAQSLTRMSIAAFHMGTRPNAVTATMNAATTPSTPLPPPMATTSTVESNSKRAHPSAATTGATTDSLAAETTPDREEVLQEDEDTSTFAEFVPVSPEQARSLSENPILSQLVNTIMKSGMKARSQRFVADAMLEIRSRTQSDPYQVVLDAIELASPILKLSAVKKGSKVLQVPTPMTERQRRRKAIVWIVEASDKRKGERQFKDRLATEFLAVVNGNSGALVKKNQLHKAALANRANANLKY